MDSVCAFRGSILLQVILAALLSGCGPAPAGARIDIDPAAAVATVPPTFLGLNVGLGGSWSTDPVRRALVFGSGVTAMRVDTYLDQHSPSPGVYDSTALDALLQMAHQHDVAALVILAYNPPWLRDPSIDPGNLGITTSLADTPPTDDNAWAGLAAQVVAHVQTLGEPVVGWEIWNEPNNHAFFGHPGWSDAKLRQDYYQLLEAAAATIHGVDPKATVVGGVYAQTYNVYTDFLPGLPELLAADTGAQVNAVSFHTYPGLLPGLQNYDEAFYLDAIDKYRGWVQQARQIAAQQGRSNLRFLMSEGNMNVLYTQRTPLDLSVFHAMYWALLSFAMLEEGVEMSVYFNTQGEPFGMLRADGSTTNIYDLFVLLSQHAKAFANTRWVKPSGDLAPLRGLGFVAADHSSVVLVNLEHQAVERTLDMRDVIGSTCSLRALSDDGLGPAQPVLASSGLVRVVFAARSITSVRCAR